MKDLIKRLVTLQQVDTRILEKRAFIDRVPGRINEVDEPLKAARAELELVRQRNDASAKKKKEKERLLEDINDKIKKAKGRISDLKTNKEYQAHLKEIEASEREIRSIEDQILAIMEEMEKSLQNQKQIEGRVKSEEDKLNAFRRGLEEEVAQYEKELEGLKAERGGLAASVDRDAYNAYMALLATGSGLAVTSARNEICTGCNMNMPPQLFVELRKGEELIQCPQCRRILYYSEEQ
ncbi:MAG: C4-type zinc ribbon domain-containing protein [Nitrospiraceae bacterium]|nr:C4-type zinc ribbon domain-containing protein [Nitrospiraceae bacterium]